jgi:hypothetical protein
MLIGQFTAKGSVKATSVIPVLKGTVFDMHIKIIVFN